jgi:chorismate-pyruvate lyase
LSDSGASLNPIIELQQLVGLFPEPDGARLYEHAEHIAREATPEPYHRMLVHEHHMTVTMEAYHDCSVDVNVLESRFEDDLYLRKILLKKCGTSDVVQFGLVRFNFDYVTTAVKDEILAQKTPLGRVLIQHNVLRHIDLGAIIRFSADVGLCKYLPMSPGQITYGRMATIFCNGAPAVDLLEISSPLK